MKKKLLAILLAAGILLTLCPAALAAEIPADAIAGAQKYLLESLPRGTSGGAADHVMFTLVRSGAALPEGYALQYYESVTAELAENGSPAGRGRSGEFARAALALRAMGKDPTNVCGQNLLTALADFDACAQTGLPGVLTALRTLDCANYDIPAVDGVSTPATRELYLSTILNAQLPDGGWALHGGKADAATTASVLQALARYRDQQQVANAVALGVERLSALQQDDGGYTVWSTPSSEPTAQVLLALCALDITVDDERFTKNGATALDKLLSYRDASGGFLGTLHPSLTATYQALQALCAVQRAQSAQAELYDLRDVTLTAQPELASGVKAAQLQKNGAVFSDTEAHENRDAISILGSFGIISGVGNGRFSPDSTMTRAQFAKIVVCALGLEAQYRGTFADVAESAWYAPYVDTAAAYGIVRGVGDGKFNPDSSITRQESAVMLARAAALCGFDTAVEDTSAVPDTVSDWAGSGVAFCLKNEIMTTAQAEQPTASVLRCEIAQMLCNLLMQTAILKF